MKNIPYALKPNDKVAIISLSSGLLVENFVKHQLDFDRTIKY